MEVQVKTCHSGSHRPRLGFRTTCDRRADFVEAGAALFAPVFGEWTSRRRSLTSFSRRHTVRLPHRELLKPRARALHSPAAHRFPGDETRTVGPGQKEHIRTGHKSKGVVAGLAGRLLQDRDQDRRPPPPL